MTALLAPSDGAIAEAAACLEGGGLVAFPTETVYGLGADACSEAATAALYAAKGRPLFNPLIAHVADLASALRQGRFSAEAERLAVAFWPGPLTLVVPAAPSCTVGLLARAGLGSVALRVPAHPVAQGLLRRHGGPVAAPSANRSGRVSPTTAAHVRADLDGRIDLILDGGPCPVGLESSIVACLDAPVLLRPGGLDREAIESVLGRPLAAPAGLDDAAPVAPGRLASHYAPRARLTLDCTAPGEGVAILDFGGRLSAWRTGRPYHDLSATADLREAAAALFAALHALDAAGWPAIAVAPVPVTGLGAAINDRLARAAAPREA